MKTIEAALEAVMAAAQQAKHETIDVPDDMPIGGVVRQGDVFYVRVPAEHPHGAETGRQVVTGETRGSRHTAEHPAVCYAGTKQQEIRTKGKLVALKEAFLGACVLSPSRFMCLHPEHGHYSLPAGGWQVVQQMDERTRARMAD